MLLGVGRGQTRVVGGTQCQEWEKNKRKAECPVRGLCKRTLEGKWEGLAEGDGCLSFNKGQMEQEKVTL